MLIYCSTAGCLCQRVLVARRGIPDDAHLVDRLLALIGDSLLLLWRPCHSLELVVRASGVRRAILRLVCLAVGCAALSRLLLLLADHTALLDCRGLVVGQADAATVATGQRLRDDLPARLQQVGLMVHLRQLC